MSKLEDKVVVITGASSGFGKGAAIRFCEAGAKVVVAARRDELLDDLVDDCRAAGGLALAVTTDVSRPEDVERLARRALEVYGRIDVWVNNAGVGAIGPFERIPLEIHRQLVETNLLGTLYGAHFAYTRFLEQGEGVLINIASELGRHTVPYYASYAAAKHGVVGLGDALRQELAQKGVKGIHVCTVMPAAHDTPFFDHAANYSGHEVQAPRPLHDPTEVVDAIVRLAADPADKEMVGADGIVKVVLKKLAPKAEEKLAARSMHTTQMEKAPPAGDTAGAVRTPLREGREASGGRREKR